MNHTIRALFDRYKLPEGCTHFGLRAVNPDLTSSHGFRWAFPGGWSQSDYAADDGNTTGCPSGPGDGICLATSWKGIRSGGIPAITLLVCAYNETDLLGTTDADQKCRVRRAITVDVVWLKMLCEPGMDATSIQAVRADLTGANLACATLTGATLRGADLACATLAGADLTGANLADADLRGAIYDDATVFPAGFDPAAAGMTQ